MSAGSHTVAETARLVRSKERSAEEVARHTAAAIAAANDRLGAFLQVFEDEALERARAIDKRIGAGEDGGPLAGVPIALKDNICTTTGRTTCASRFLENFESRFDATVVQKLERAGAIIIGKTNLDEFAMGSSTEHSALAKTSNPWNTSRVPGGSSGGSVVAVAARMVPGALGSDTGGSIRQPSAFCGTVGLKPSYGRVSRFGLVAFGSSVDQIGPIARTAEDAAILLSAIAGSDDRDSTCVDQPPPGANELLGKSLAGLRIGLSDEYFGEGLSAEVREVVLKAIDVLKKQGAITVPISLPHMKYAIACYYIVAVAEASSNLARFDGIHYGRRATGPTEVIELYAASRGEGFGTEVQRRIMLGTYALSSGYYDAYYLRALKVRTLIKRDFDEAFAKVDVIASPVTPTTAFAIGEKSSDPLEMYLADAYTVSANLAGICAVSIPAGFDSAGLPVGLQLMGPHFGEPAILSAAHQFQQHTDHHSAAPPVAAGEPG